MYYFTAKHPKNPLLPCLQHSFLINRSLGPQDLDYGWLLQSYKEGQLASYELHILPVLALEIAATNGPVRAIISFQNYLIDGKLRRIAVAKKRNIDLRSTRTAP